ncbi:MAG: helix-turn-helix transcriptional regulator [Thermoguttaceae bacterium]|jgi:DNA-binding XRE family transcriptional regulator
MKKKIKKELDDELRPEYDLSKLKGGVRGKYAKRFKAGTNLVLPLERQASKMESSLPAYPPADKKGNLPALDYCRVSIARDIIKERQALGLTQEQLAKLAGLRQETLSRLESGKHSPTVRTVDKIDQALKRYAKSKRKQPKKGK